MSIYETPYIPNNFYILCNNRSLSYEVLVLHDEFEDTVVL